MTMKLWVRKIAVEQAENIAKIGGKLPWHDSQPRTVGGWLVSIEGFTHRARLKNGLMTVIQPAAARPWR